MIWYVEGDRVCGANGDVMSSPGRSRHPRGAARYAVGSVRSGRDAGATPPARRMAGIADNDVLTHFRRIERMAGELGLTGKGLRAGAGEVVERWKKTR